MFIEQIDIKGFRGIKQLSLRLNAKSSVLIGENQWGKSSLISALKLLTLDNKFYQFVNSDFYYDKDDGNHISINVVYCESYATQLTEQAYQPLTAVSYRSPAAVSYTHLRAHET